MVDYVTFLGAKYTLHPKYQQGDIILLTDDKYAFRASKSALSDAG
jgi:hypothetical protein